METDKKLSWGKLIWMGVWLNFAILASFFAMLVLISWFLGLDGRLLGRIGGMVLTIIFPIWIVVSLVSVLWYKVWDKTSNKGLSKC